MAENRAKGTPIPNNAELEHVASALRGSLGDVNLQDRGLGHGVYKDGMNVGSRDSVWATRILTGAGVIDIPHKLGRVPGFAKLHEVLEGVDTTAQVLVRSVDRTKWTVSTFRVRVQAVSGSLSGMTLTFEVGG